MLSFHISAPLLTVPSVFAKRRSRRESKNGFPPISIFREKRSKIRKRAAKHFEGLAALSTHSAGRRAAVKAGCKSVHFSLDSCPLPCYFSGSVATTSGHLSTSRSVDEELGLSYMPCLLMKPDLRLRLHATQAQPCFLAASNLAASNALALPGGNGIFTTTPTERITHYTLLRKVVWPNGGVAPFGNTHKKRRYAPPSTGRIPPFSCYPALRLYRLSKSQRGNGVVSLSK